MNKNTIVYFKNRLTKELSDLQNRENCNLNGLKILDENPPDLVDRASNLIDRSLSQSFCERENLKIRRLKQAIEDIANDDYGICRNCGEDIAVKRLKANPIARHCITCKAAIEERVRLTGN
jgi:DnaK suppressor protein